MQYIGVDIIEIGRIQQAIERWGDRFLRRIYTDAELSICRGKPLVILYSQAREKASNFGLKGLAISLSHSRDYAIAFVVGERE
jgi:holo-[acyl-carrier protein] synthase